MRALLGAHDVEEVNKKHYNELDDKASLTQ